MKLNSLILFLFLSTFANNPANGEPTKPSIFDQLLTDEALNVTIAVDLDTLTANFRSNKKHSAVFSYTDHTGMEQNWDIKVKLRGKFRRMTCGDTPPLKLYFGKDDLKSAGLAKYNDLKLVNYCADDQEEAKALLLKEYLAYKIYNELTDASFRVQLINVTYKDVGSSQEVNQYAFLIEDAAQLRSRMGAEKYNRETELTNPKEIDADLLQTVSLFQYMIGNTDWKFDFEKNTKFMLKGDKRLVVPYDFDFSGIVNPSYGKADSSYGLTTLTQRVYLGNPDELENIKPTIKLFKSKRKAIYSLVKSTKLLPKKSRKEILIYLDSFYDTLSKETLSAACPKK